MLINFCLSSRTHSFTNCVSSKTSQHFLTSPISARHGWNTCVYMDVIIITTDVIIWESILTENASFGGVRLRLSMLCLFLVVVFVLLCVCFLVVDFVIVVGCRVLFCLFCFVFICFSFSNRVFSLMPVCGFVPHLTVLSHKRAMHAVHPSNQISQHSVSDRFLVK